MMTRGPLLSDFLDACLTTSLAERVHVVRDGVVSPSGGEFVLYWMHHAVRGHDNPALDVGRLLANAFARPLIVYQGLGGHHAFNNDRHHTFILQGARDAAAELRTLGIRHAMHLPHDPSQSTPLASLAERAVAIVTEDFPAPPFPRWTRRLADRSGRPLVMVDTACIVPMRLIEGCHDRAFSFRNKSKKQFSERADRPYTSIAVATSHAGAVELGFRACDLATVDIPDEVARCEIDHSITPVAHTPGGSHAGYTRWEAFKAKGLGRYHKRRNAAEIDRDELSVSRLSPYLHHGHVSPFRLIRETRALLSGSTREGAEKYIDELWLWREFAHHFTLRHADDVHTTRALPEWALRTISDHADDPRDLFDRETLGRARTGDALWDAAQRSLMAHGEVHNNVRMTWGKALLAWHTDASSTLDALIHLNHSLALDGSDPNSYGGLLWSLGALDGPFHQDEPVYGTIRTRPTSVHAQRIDLERYRRNVAQPNWRRPLRVGVIGGGIAGLAAARVLADHNAEVVVLDKGRGPGGRASTRRRDEHVLDHGAQYFTVHDPRFGRVVDAWVDQGLACEWEPRLAEISAPARITERPSRERCLVGAPEMSAIARHMVATLGGEGEVRFGRAVAKIAFIDGGWDVLCDDMNQSERFDALVVAVPAPQAHALLGGISPLAEHAAAVRMSPCWAGLYAFDHRLPIEADGIFVNIGDSPLAWIARDSSKPYRPSGERWVAHAKPGWTYANLESGRESVAADLLAALTNALGIDRPDPLFADAHRWRFAQGAAVLSADQRFDAATCLALAGDWTHGGRIEGAYLSGVAAAGRILGETVAVAQRNTASQHEPTA